MGKQVLGAVLAGGRSRRFGSDKADALFAGRPLIAHAIASLRETVTAVVVCGRVVAGEASLVDRPTPDMGPLGGLNAALHFAHESGFDGVLSIGCDMPVLPVELAASLIGEGAAIVEGQHLVGYWPSALSPLLNAHLETLEDRSIRSWLAVATPRVVPLAGPPLPNINTPADLAALVEHWSAER